MQNTWEAVTVMGRFRKNEKLDSSYKKAGGGGVWNHLFPELSMIKTSSQPSLVNASIILILWSKKQRRGATT